MRQHILSAGVLAIGVLALAGCGTSSGGATGSLSAGTSSASSSLSAATSNACHRIAQTLDAAPSRLEQAFTSNAPAQNAKSTLQSILSELKSEANNGGANLRAAVQDYGNQLQQVVNTAASGHMPDLSKLNPSRINGICSQAGVQLNTTGSSASTSSSVSSFSSSLSSAAAS